MIREQHTALKKFIFITDLVIVSGSFFVGYFIRESIDSVVPTGVAPIKEYIGLFPVLLILWGSLLYYFGMYRSITIAISDAIIIVIKAALVGFVLFGSYVFVLHLQEEVARIHVGVTFSIAGLLIISEKIALYYIFRHLRKKVSSFKGALFAYRNILIVGTNKRARHFIKAIKENPDWAIRISGIVDLEEANKGLQIDGYEVIGNFDDMPDIIHKNIIDEVVFIVPRTWLNKIENMLLFCESEGVVIHLAVDLFNLKISELRQTDLHGFPLLTFMSTTHKFENLFIKRVFDFVSAGFGILVLSPVLLILTLIIKATSRGPVLFKQERCSLYGRKFVFYKFRTMVADAEEKLEELLRYNEMSGPVFKMTNDPRVTKIGAFLRKYSLDELPQLWNVIKGDMSLVGPRPPIPAEVEEYNNWQRRKLSMRPGITCLWQISGRSDIADFDEWMKLDLEYIDNWTLLLDFKIIFKTIPVVLLGQGAK